MSNFIHIHYPHSGKMKTALSPSSNLLNANKDNTMIFYKAALKEKVV